MGFSENLKSLRQRQHLSQQQLADKLGVKRQSLSAWEQPDGARPDFYNLVCLVQALDTTWNELMEGEIELHKKQNSALDQIPGAVAALRTFATAFKTLNLVNDHSIPDDSHERK